MGVVEALYAPHFVSDQGTECSLLLWSKINQLKQTRPKDAAASSGTSTPKRFDRACSAVELLLSSADRVSSKMARSVGDGEVSLDKQPQEGLLHHCN